MQVNGKKYFWCHRGTQKLGVGLPLFDHFEYLLQSPSLVLGAWTTSQKQKCRTKFAHLESQVKLQAQLLQQLCVSGVFTMNCCCPRKSSLNFWCFQCIRLLDLVLCPGEHLVSQLKQFLQQRKHKKTISQLSQAPNRSWKSLVEKGYN